MRELLPPIKDGTMFCKTPATPQVKRQFPKSKDRKLAKKYWREWFKSVEFIKYL